jgi:hypothetical protein
VRSHMTDRDPDILIDNGYTHTRPVKHEKPKEATLDEVTAAIREARAACASIGKSKPRTPVSVVYSDGTSEAVTGWGFTNIDTSLCDLSGNKTATQWKYDASKCCGPLSGTECAAMVADMRSPAPAPAPPKLPALPTPPVDEPWFDGLLWTEYLTYWHKRQAEVAVLPLPIPDRDTFSSVGYHVQTFADWLDSKKNVDHHNKKHAEYIAKETAARVAYVKSVQAARKPKAKGGGK